MPYKGCVCVCVCVCTCMYYLDRLSAFYVLVVGDAAFETFNWRNLWKLPGEFSSAHVLDPRFIRGLWVLNDMVYMLIPFPTRKTYPLSFHVVSFWVYGVRWRYLVGSKRSDHQTGWVERIGDLKIDLGWFMWCFHLTCKTYSNKLRMKIGRKNNPTAVFLLKVEVLTSKSFIGWMHLWIHLLH